MEIIQSSSFTKHIHMIKNNCESNTNNGSHNKTTSMEVKTKLISNPFSCHAYLLF